MSLETVAGLVADEYNNIKTIDSVHKEIHDGDMYMVSWSTTVAAGSTVFLYVQSPNTTVKIHFIAQVNSSITTITSYFSEGTLASSSLYATAKTAYNMNRASTKVTSAVFGTVSASSGFSTYAPVKFENYTNQMPAYIGSLQSGAAYTEWVLAANSTYIVGVTCPTTAAITVNVKAYEG
jgi:hypothetical protein